MNTLEKNTDKFNQSAGDFFNPFPGLRPFTTDESHLFFGREGQSQEILKLLAQNKFVALLGTSGSGKSSLMYCGVIPILQGGFITSAGADWDIITCRPGQEPIKNLSEAISHSFTDIADNINLEKEYINATLSASSLGLSEVLSRLYEKKSRNILLLVDQFEELFRFKKIKNTEDALNEVLAYIKLLLEVQKNSNLSAYIVITMRSDFIGECAQFQEFTKLINDSHYLIPQMTRNDFRKAIEGPVAVGGGKITPFMVQQLLNDIGENPDQLPILQHTLMRTWDAWVKSGQTEEPINIKNYEAVGKLEKALSDHANEAYNELSLEQKELCRIIFKTLTEKGGDNRGVRRPTPIVEIANIAGTTTEDIIEVVEFFRKPGRSFLSPAPPAKLTKETVIDISHESLMRIWDKLIVWVNEEYEAVQMYKRLSDSAEKYQKGEAGLWRPPDLLLALSWREKQKPTLAWASRYNSSFERTMVFLETSHKEYKIEEENKIRKQKQALRRTRMFAIILGSASIISIFFMVQAFANKQEAEKQTKLAKQQTEIAKLQKELAVKQKKIADEQKIKAVKNEKEALTQKELAEKEKQKAAYNAKIARMQEKIANQKSIEASKQKELAEQNLQEAQRQQKIAEQAKLNAQKLRMLSISKSMAVKSLQVDVDTMLRGLLAYQSYLFNNKYKGNIFNSDIYNALYFSYKYFYENKKSDYLVHTYQVRDITIDSKKQKFYSTGSDGKVFLLSVGNVNDTTLLLNTHEINRTLSLSPDKNTLLVGTSSGKLILYDLIAKTDYSVIYNFNNPVNGILFVNNNKIIAYGSGGKIIYHNLQNNNTDVLSSDIALKQMFKSEDVYYAVAKNGLLYKISSLQPLKYELYALKYSSDGKKGSLVKNDTSEIIINSAACSNDGKYLAVGDIVGNVLLFEKDNYKFLYRYRAHAARVNSIAFDDKSEYMATAGNDGKILIWTTQNFNLEPYKLTDNEAWVMLIKFINGKSSLLAAYADGKIRKWAVDYTEMASEVKQKINRNFTHEEWQLYVAKDIDYQKTIPELP